MRHVPPKPTFSSLKLKKKPPPVIASILLDEIGNVHFLNVAGKIVPPELIDEDVKNRILDESNQNVPPVIDFQQRQKLL